MGTIGIISIDSDRNTVFILNVSTEGSSHALLVDREESTKKKVLARVKIFIVMVMVIVMLMMEMVMMTKALARSK